MEPTSPTILHLYRIPGLPPFQHRNVLHNIGAIGLKVLELDTEMCFNVLVTEDLTAEEYRVLFWLLSETFEQNNLRNTSFLQQQEGHEHHFKILEVGPRLNFTTAWSTNAVTICNFCGLKKVKRIERSTRYLLKTAHELTQDEVKQFLDQVHDKMTQCPYTSPLDSFKADRVPLPVQAVPILENGKEALDLINEEMGLAFDDQDKALYLKMFQEMGRNPTTVELFDLSQSNSEHSRHWFFRGKQIIDGQEMPNTLMKIVQQTLSNSNNSVIAFSDNSSAIEGYEILTIQPRIPGSPSSFELQKKLHHIVFTAETHNFPTGVAPFPGAETGTGGRIRDVQAVGKGGHVLAGTAAYCVGNLSIPGYHLPWEDPEFEYPSNLAKPLKIEIEASNGASDYGNKFGEPIIQGFTRSFGLRLPNGERREYIKPIMFTGGIGQMDSAHVTKGKPEKGMLVVKIGGPAYRIGMGGGSASSMVQGENKESLDFNAVQRGDAEMEQKLNRVVRACIELGEKNPIVSIHDQGAGGSANVVKELIEPDGARINIRSCNVADETLSVMEIWGAEYQENNALLIRSEHQTLLEAICKREHLPIAFIGNITGDGKIVLCDEKDNTTPVDLELKKVLGEMPQKPFMSRRIQNQLKPLELPSGLTLKLALDRVLRLVSVGSKLFLTNKVDRSVTGLIAQQQCVGPLHLPLSNVSVVALSEFNLTGAASSIGEQPIKGLVNTSAMARMTVGEALTNLVWAQISKLQDVKCSGNWMWAAKLPNEGAALYDAAVAMRDVMKQLGIAIDGGKDSLSMASRVQKNGSAEVVKAPGTLVVSTYVECPDITKTVTPDIKFPGNSKLLFVDLGCGKNRMGGSALAHVFSQIGHDSPDLEDANLFKLCFNAVQRMIEQNLLAAGHDRSDGGLLTTLLEMAFSGNCGIDIEVPKHLQNSDLIPFFFSEELGLVLEIHPDSDKQVQDILSKNQIPFYTIGYTREEKIVTIMVQEEQAKTVLFREDMTELRDIWNETSYRIELLQANSECVESERKALKKRKGMQFKLSFEPHPTEAHLLELQNKPKVAVLREEGSNGDRELVVSFFMAGFDVWDVTTSDLIDKRVDLKQFTGIAFPGGFSYADVMDAGKGWAGVIQFNPEVYNQFEEFYKRDDTFSLGVCNGCQLMALLGWIPFQNMKVEDQPRFIHNTSGRFESRFSTVKILPSPAIMLEGMENSVLGVWVAHGEGRAYFPNEHILETIGDLAPIRYVDDDMKITEEYPFNPNGSVKGIAALCTRDGRHLALMPHPERCTQLWHWPYVPQELKHLKASPWLKMFQNARKFCDRL